MSESIFSLEPIVGVPTVPFRSPVSRRALEARVKRALNKQDERLHKSRCGTRCFQELGEYYIIDIYSVT